MLMQGFRRPQKHNIIIEHVDHLLVLEQPWDFNSTGSNTQIFPDSFEHVSK